MSTNRVTRKVANKIDIVLVGGLIVIGVLIYLWYASDEHTYGVFAEITVDGISHTTVDLSQDRVFTIETLPGVYFEVRNGAVAFIVNDCPMQICVRRGFISQVGESVVCLPKRSVITIIGTYFDIIGR